MTRSGRNAWLGAYYGFSVINLVPLIYYARRAIQWGHGENFDLFSMLLITFYSLPVHALLIGLLAVIFAQEPKGWPFYAVFAVPVGLILLVAVTILLS